jgi:hypothetical protein
LLRILLGKERTMDLTVAAVNATVVVAVSVVLGWVGKGRIDALERQINERFAEMRERTDRVEARIDGLRSDITSVALAVGAGPRAEAGGG